MPIIADKERDVTLTKNNWRRWTRLAALVVIVIAAVLCAWQLYFMYFGTNLQVVVPGQIYRSAQLSPATLKKIVRRHGIRTVVNVRGCVPFHTWYKEEANATCDFDICQEDINLSASRIPSSSEIVRLLEILDHSEYPMLIHCRRGIDRTGLVAAVALLLRGDVTYNDARQQLCLRYGHLPVGKPTRMAAFFKLYEDWLATNQMSFSAENFRHWLLNDYRGCGCRCEFEKCELSRGPIRVQQPFSVSLRLRNGGNDTWKFSPIQSAGVHAIYVLRRPGGPALAVGRAGFFRKRIDTGESVDLVMPIAAIEEPGRYLLTVDMVDEQSGRFFQFGSEPFETRLDVIH